jgi:DNA invertase Pin-like site-specific DNA recombinase
MKTAYAYYRTSSATNVGVDKDSLARQKASVAACAASQGLQIVGEYYDAAVSGADPVEARKSFGEMLAAMLGNCARTIIVENATRFARDLMVQEIGYRMLKDRGIELVAADSPDSFVSDTPTAVLIRQILGAVAQFEKTMLVMKLRGARDRKSTKAGRRVEGAKWLLPVPVPTIRLASHLRGGGMSLRQVSAAMAERGVLGPSGHPYGAQSIKAMLARAASLPDSTGPFDDIWDIKYI